APAPVVPLPRGRRRRRARAGARALRGGDAMSEAFKKDVPADGDVAALGEIVTGAARMLVPLARMYLGPAAASVGQEGGDGRVLMLAFNKLLIEAGTLPAPGTEYEPHKTAFTIDERTGMGNAVDLPYLLGGLRALS